MRISRIAAEIRSLAECHSTTSIEIDPILEKYTTGLDIKDQRIVREIVCSVLMSLKSEGKIEFQDREIAMLLTTSRGQFTPYPANIRIRSVSERERRADRDRMKIYVGGDYVGGDNFGAIVGRNRAQTLQSVSRDPSPRDLPASSMGVTNHRNIFRSLSRWVATGILFITARVLTD